MNCSEFEKELEHLVETRSQSLPDPATDHVAECPACRQRCLDYRVLTAAIAIWRPVQTPESLAPSVLGQLLNDRLSPSTIRPAAAISGRGWVPVTAAACLLAVLSVGISIRSTSIDRSLAQKQNQPAPTNGQLADAPVEVVSSMAAVLDDLRTEYRGLAADTTATAREFAVVIPSSPAISWADVGLSNTPAMSDVPDHEQSASPGAVTAIGRSIGTQITQAMDFLWTTVPQDIPRG